MLRIQKGETNYLYATLYENSTVANPIYLFKFTSQQSNVDYYFISTDTSEYITRFNKFTLIEKEDADTLDGEVTLGYEGFYDYTAYQTTLTTLSGLTTAADAIPYILKTVEVGLVMVELPTQEEITYTDVAQTNIIYQNEL